MNRAEHAQAILDARTETEILGALARAVWSDTHEGKCPAERIPSGANLAAYLGEAVPADPFNVPEMLPVLTFAFATDGSARVTMADVPALHAAWLELDPAKRGKHPAAALVRAWQNRPAEVEAETRLDLRIFPKVVPAMSLKRRLPLLTGAAKSAGQLPLCLFAEPDALRVPLLDLVDATGVPIMARGRGAPLPLRVVVRVLMAVPVSARGRGPVSLSVPTRELTRAFMGESYRPHKHWPRILEALQTVHNARAILDGQSVALCMVGRWPADGDPDGEIRFICDLPDGAGEGPVIDLPLLDALGRESAPRFRAYLAVQSVNWRKGITRLPVDKRRGVWRWAKDASRYPVFTREDRRRLAFGMQDEGNRTKAQIDAAFEGLPGLVVADRRAVDPKSGAVGWRIIPDGLTVENERVNRRIRTG